MDIDSKFRCVFMQNSINIILTIISTLLLASFVVVLRLFKKRESSYRKALESVQKKLDFQVSRIGILTQILPSIQNHILNPHESEDWMSICLDEVKSLIRAESASYFRYLEREQKFDIEMMRGYDPFLAHPIESFEKILFKERESVRKGLTVLSDQQDGAGSSFSILIVPLLIENRVRGCFRFSRKSDDGFSKKEMDLITMVFHQIGLALEIRASHDDRGRFYLELIQSLADLIDSKDALTEGQTRRTRALAREVGKEMDMPSEFIYYLEFAALMHDLGNVAIDEKILKKPGRLTAEEFAIVKKHPEYGYKILSSVSMLAPVAPMVLYHQEWFNGKGYPEGLSGEEIPLGSRIVAVLDAWSAMTTPRSWRKALSRFEALEEIKKGAGTQFDPRVVEAFVATIEKSA